MAENGKFAKKKSEFRYFFLDVLRTLTALIEEKDPFLRRHSQRVANNCANFCERFKIVDEDDIENIYYAGVLHDIGFITVPLEILQKPEPITEENMVWIKKHPVRGEKILAHLSYVKEILPIIRHHHEAIDGSGFPDGLKKDNIPLGARVVALFNHFDNLVFPRSSQKATSVVEALEMIMSNAGKLFDEKLIQNFLEFIAETSGKSEDYLQKKETASMKEVFAEIIHRFKTGKINPPVMPKIVREMQTVMKQVASTTEDIAQVVEKDPVISLRLISVANSPIYRGITEIRNVKSAIPRLGIKESLNIVMTIANKNLYETENIQCKILMDKLWVHALASAYGAKLIAQSVNHQDDEKLFLMGLTHDIGKILLLKAFSEVSKSNLLNIDEIAESIKEAHIGLGNMLLRRWGFEPEFLNVISHHEDMEFTEDTAKDILIVHLANIITRQIGFSLTDDETDAAETESAKILNMEPEAIEGIGQGIKKIIQDVAHLF
jgi:HD-GYP domain-containing protein (c-di-GMP phosphodiesterase class II)